jgi:adenylate kinase family enzyme
MNGLGQRIVVIGPTGSGKSTLAAELAKRSGLPPIELDALFWLPNWTMKADEHFRADVRNSLDAASQGWVVAGSYFRQTQGMAMLEADTIIWLRLPFRTTFPRLFWRTVRRAATGESLWGTNRETWRKAFLSRDSLLLYAISIRRTHEARTQERLEALAPKGRLVVLRSPGEVRGLLRLLPSP